MHFRREPFKNKNKYFAPKLEFGVSLFDILFLFMTHSEYLQKGRPSEKIKGFWIFFKALQISDEIFEQKKLKEIYEIN